MRTTIMITTKTRSEAVHMSDYLDPNNEELLKDFYSEAQMQVEVMEQNILALEDDPGRPGCH